MTENKFSIETLKLDYAKEADHIAEVLRGVVHKKFRKKGAVVAISGGIDSSTVAGLCVKAFGKENVLGLLLPEKDSSPDTPDISRQLADHLGIDSVYENITPILSALGCYEKRDAAIREVMPEFDSTFKSKIVLPSVIDNDSFRIYSVVTQSPKGEIKKTRLNLKAYLGIVAATNFKQRVRKMLEYYHADRMNYAVSGTPNRLEYDQGFFVKLGDGAADVKPIAHLYKTQVYQMAAFLGLPEEIVKREPTTDTYSLPQGQDEFYFSLPYDKMDLCLFGKNNNISKQEIADAASITVEQLNRVYHDIDQKRKTTEYLHFPPLLIDKVDEIEV